MEFWRGSSRAVVLDGSDSGHSLVAAGVVFGLRIGGEGGGRCPVFDGPGAVALLLALLLVGPLGLGAHLVVVGLEADCGEVTGFLASEASDVYSVATPTVVCRASALVALSGEGTRGDEFFLSLLLLRTFHLT